jgi:hypothetical protein
MEAVGFFDMSTSIYQTTQCYIPVDYDLIAQQILFPLTTVAL